MIPTLYRGSVKNLLGPVRVGEKASVVFEYTDGYSVFDWGKMPDLLTHKGSALAILAADLFEKLEKPEVWKEYSKSSEALSLRKSNRFGSIFNEFGEELQSQGLRTHYLGCLDKTPQDADLNAELNPKRIGEMKGPFRQMVVSQVSVAKPSISTILGRSLYDYYATRSSAPPRLIPLEVVFRLSCPPGSSLIERCAQNPSYLASLGYPDLKLEPGVKWDFPVLELFSKLEMTDRPVSLSEALAISGLSAPQLQEILLKTVWLSGFLRYWLGKFGLELADGKFEWAVSKEGRCFLVDAIGPDELRILKNGIQFSKEFLRSYYRKTPWYEAMEKAKSQAKAQGIVDWKRLLSQGPPALPTSHRELGIQIYLALANTLTERAWFPDAWSLPKVISQLQSLDPRES